MAKCGQPGEVPCSVVDDGSAAGERQLRLVGDVVEADQVTG